MFKNKTDFPFDFAVYNNKRVFTAFRSFCAAITFGHGHRPIDVYTAQECVHTETPKRLSNSTATARSVIIRSFSVNVLTSAAQKYASMMKVSCLKAEIFLVIGFVKWSTFLQHSHIAFFYLFRL